MVKVSITLPNNALITFEAEEPEVIHEIVGMVLRDLPRDLMQVSVAANGNGGHHPEPVNGKTAIGSAIGVADVPSLDQTASQSESINNPTSSRLDVVPAVEPAKPLLRDAEHNFVEFCLDAKPLGDMRRVVVAAEGARQFLDAASVDADELGRLFDLAGWRRPHSFVQTLRNAARSKFRWLERVPGRSGYYTVTEVGRNTALSN